MTEGNNNKDKAWFDDDPEWVELRRRAAGRPLNPVKQRKSKISRKQLIRHQVSQKPPAQTPKPSKPVKDVNISVDLKLKVPHFTKKQLKTAGLAVGILTISVIGTRLIPGWLNKDEAKRDVLSQQAPAQPQFDTITPEGKDAEEFGGFKLISPPDNAPVYTFVDTLDTATVRVSQQELPDSFKDNVDEVVRKTAEDFSATDVINESNPRAYLGTDAKGPQTVIFHKNGLLIIINSNKTVERDRWAEYVTKLI